MGLGAACPLGPPHPEAGAVPHHHPLQWVDVAAARIPRYFLVVLSLLRLEMEKAHRGAFDLGVEEIDGGEDLTAGPVGSGKTLRGECGWQDGAQLGSRSELRRRVMHFIGMIISAGMSGGREEMPSWCLRSA